MELVQLAADADSYGSGEVRMKSNEVNWFHIGVATLFVLGWLIALYILTR